MDNPKPKDLIKKSLDLSEQAAHNTRLGTFQKAQSLELSAISAALQALALIQLDEHERAYPTKTKN